MRLGVAELSCSYHPVAVIVSVFLVFCILQSCWRLVWTNGNDNNEMKDDGEQLLQEWSERKIPILSTFK